MRPLYALLIPLLRGWLWLGLCMLAAMGRGAYAAELPDVIPRVKAAVVIVGTFRMTDSPRFRLRGTGFAVGEGSSNLVVTNLHVLPESTENQADMQLVVQVRQGDRGLEMRNARVLEIDPIHDLALLRIEGVAVPALRVRDSGTVREGQSAAFMGFPIGGALGFSSVTHRAMISSIAPIVLPAATATQLSAAAIRNARAGVFDIFQLDGTAYPGNSGGPLFDPASGDLLGVINMVFIKGSRESALSAPSGITYAIPSRFVGELLARVSAR